MSWEIDSDLMEDKKNKFRGTSSLSTTTPGTPEEVLESNLKSKTPPEVPIRIRKTGGWANEGNKTAKMKNSDIIEQERFQKEKSKDSVDDIPIIPDIEDIQNDSQNISDMKVLNVTVKESTYKELNNQFENLQTGELTFGNLGDIDLTILTSKLYPEKDVQKCTDTWTVDSLFKEISKS